MIVDRDPAPYDAPADAVVRDPIGEVPPRPAATVRAAVR